LFSYDYLKRWRAEEERIDTWVAKVAAQESKGDAQVANLEVIIKGYCGITYRQLDKAIAKYERIRGPSFARAKEKLREQFATNPFSGLLKNSCPFFQQQVDEIRRKFDAQT
jgi:hypothetical protein